MAKKESQEIIIRETISQTELIEKYKKSPVFMHLAKTPISDSKQHMITKHRQMYIWGFNSGGRPEGFWISYGTSWLETTVILNSPRFPACCYLYEVGIKPRSKVIHINSTADLQKFDDRTPSYWLNFDYFNLDFVDYLTGERIVSPQKYTFRFDQLRKKPDESFRTVLLNNNIIFNTAASAKKHCEFYNRINIATERFKYKDWAEICVDSDGILFKKYDKNDPKWMYYIWFQTLDVASGCIWNPECIAEVSLKYVKKDINTWEKVE